MLRVKVRSLLILLGVLALFSWSPADAEAQLGSRLFRGRCLPRLFHACPQPCPCRPIVACPSPCANPCQQRCENVKCGCCEFALNGNVWRWVSYDCKAGCECHLPTSEGGYRPIGCQTIQNTPAPGNFQLRLEGNVRNNYHRFAFTLPVTNSSWEYFIQTGEVHWSVNVELKNVNENPPMGCNTAGEGQPPPKWSKFFHSSGEASSQHTEGDCVLYHYDCTRNGSPMKVFVTVRRVQ